jgi:Cu/Ag efflux pump CusA
MPVDVFPDLTAPTVTVITEAHGMAPTEVESQVTFPVEAALNGAPGVRRVRSSTAVGISVVWVEFDWDTDIYAARQVVSEKIALVASSLPPEVERPILAPISSIMGEILFISLASDRHNAIELRTTADTVLRRRLLSVPGVSQVTPIGGETKQYQAVLAPSKLQAYGLAASQAMEALAASNQNVSAGFMVDGGSEYLTTGIGRVRSLEDIGDTVVAAPDGVPVRIADLGTVRIGEAPKRGEGSANARPAVILGIQKQPRTNTLALTRALDAVLDELQAKLPEGMKIDKRILRQADFIEVAVRNVQHALRDGGLLVVVVAPFPREPRATLITLTAIPLAGGQCCPERLRRHDQRHDPKAWPSRPARSWTTPSSMSRTSSAASAGPRWHQKSGGLPSRSCMTQASRSVAPLSLPRSSSSSFSCPSSFSRVWRGGCSSR